MFDVLRFVDVDVDGCMDWVKEWRIGVDSIDTYSANAYHTNGMEKGNEREKSFMILIFIYPVDIYRMHVYFLSVFGFPPGAHEYRSSTILY